MKNNREMMLTNITFYMVHFPAILFPQLKYDSMQFFKKDKFSVIISLHSMQHKEFEMKKGLQLAYPALT